MAPPSDEEEDDYLNMTFEEPAATKKETSLQRTARLKKESAERGRIPSKAEKEAAATAAREKALATEMESTNNKGAKMMAKMGFKAGGGLGAVGNEGRTRPVELGMKGDKGGIGADSEKKRKIREAAEEAEQGVKRTKMTEGEFRERNMREREEKRAEGMWYGAMKVLEGLEEDDCNTVADAEKKNGGGKDDSTKKPLKSVDLLCRPLVRDRLQKESERRACYDLTQSLARNQEYAEEDADDKLALSGEVTDLEEEDPELDEYEALPFIERLEKVVKHLREKYWYCFWCKYRYKDEGMEDCPGLTEDEHG